MPGNADDPVACSGHAGEALHETSSETARPRHADAVSGTQHRRMNDRTCARWILVGVFSLPLAIAIALGAARLANDYRLRCFSRALFDVPLPVGAREIARSREVGVFEGNGNHCDFRATRTLRTDLGESSLQRHFAAHAYPPVSAGGSPVLTVDRRAEVVTITLYDGCYDAGLDWRCH
jgi:hypothetical protein